VFDPKPVERTANLGETLSVDRFAGLGGLKIMAAAIGLEAPDGTPWTTAMRVSTKKIWGVQRVP
jgi:hypothetical protein